MTQNDQAFIAGFCKAAEIAGVDPMTLYKKAQLKARIGALVGKALAGAAKAKTTAGNAAVAAGNAAAAGGKRYLELLRGGRPTFLEQMRQGIGVERLSRPLERLRMALKNRASLLRGGVGQNAADVLEARKALAVQLGTAGAVGDGIYGLTRGRKAAPAGDNTQQQK